MAKGKPQTKFEQARAVIDRYDALLAKAKAISDAELRAVTLSALESRADGELRALFPGYTVMNTTSVPMTWTNTASGGA